MELFTKVFGIGIKNMGKEITLITMVTHIMAIGIKVNAMESECTHGKVREYLSKEHGSMVYVLDHV